jgi:ElaB/YqjD/DUF883 family membrane-anchored ribosome-binding protein
MGNSASAVAESIGHAAAEQAHRLGEQAQQWQESATKMAQDTYSNVRDSASEYIQQGRERAMQLEESVETFIHDQPLKSILIAAGIGFACGFLLMRRESRAVGRLIRARLSAQSGPTDVHHVRCAVGSNSGDALEASDSSATPLRSDAFLRFGMA